MSSNEPELVEGANPDQPQEAQEIVRKTMKKFWKYKRHRAKYDKNWMHFYRIFRGDQWDGIRMPKFRQKEIVNMIWQTIQSNLPLQTDIRPKMTYIPINPEDRDFATVLNDLSNSDWERNNWLVPLTETILDGYLYGLGIVTGKQSHDPQD